MKKLNVSFKLNIDPKDYKKPFILICNHASRLDYIYASVALLPLTLNYVAGYNEFFRSHLAFLFRLMQVIPKKNFVSDLYAIKSMKRVLDGGGRVALFPEGMSSISGTNQPCAIASGKVIKHFNVPVLRLMIKGGYLTSTKYCLDDRPGRVEGI
ncbi:MAG: 1-acyl-sn-glycerol-3-phosphate acyltransferase [Candidatus Adiutrix sp.]|nr:1-acyl-sn-glycerol-3-phosphate acyltransferase [Candidatus Adiutrix sp.]